MSLIQEALKRKSEEEVNTPTPSAAASAGDPAPAGKSPQLLLIVLVVFLLGGVLAALVGLSLYLIKPKTAALSLPVLIAPASDPETVPETPLPAAEVSVAAAPEESAVFSEVSPPEIKSVWPELKLTGIAQSGGQSIAVLNGKMLPAGRKIGDVTLVSIHDGQVVVEYLGERRTLYINE